MEKERGKPCKKTGRKNGQELIAYLPDSIKEARTSSCIFIELVRVFLVIDSLAALKKRLPYPVISGIKLKKF